MQNICVRPGGISKRHIIQFDGTIDLRWPRTIRLERVDRRLTVDEAEQLRSSRCGLAEVYEMRCK